MKTLHVVSVKSGRPGTPTETRSEKSSTTAMTGASSGTGMNVLGGKLHTSTTAKYIRPPEAFISLQLEKVSHSVSTDDFYVPSMTTKYLVES